MAVTREAARAPNRVPPSAETLIRDKLRQYASDPDALANDVSEGIIAAIERGEGITDPGLYGRLALVLRVDVEDIVPETVRGSASGLTPSGPPIPPAARRPIA